MCSVYLNWVQTSLHWIRDVFLVRIPSTVLFLRQFEQKESGVGRLARKNKNKMAVFVEWRH